ncbi:hypothetical protein SDC9_159846 [bioreactor metagenome]|uniref:NodB homology domain-containing protein n=1 Tax=bioreactor metagenome TaxID=1076179 RepID=A0A645FDQ3_9ZZZZ
MKSSPPGRIWRPSLLIVLAWVIHPAALAAWLIWPESWPWGLAAVLASHFALTAAGLWPRSSLLGPNITRLPDTSSARKEIALTIDDGPEPTVTPAVLDLLDDLLRSQLVPFTAVGIAKRNAILPKDRYRPALRIKRMGEIASLIMDGSKAAVVGIGRMQAHTDDVDRTAPAARGLG